MMEMLRQVRGWPGALRRRGVDSRVALAMFCLACSASAAAGVDPLPSWQDTDARRSIVEFVAAVTDPNGRNYLPPAQRVAVFDNDGTLWSEQPAYFQLLFALDRVRALAPGHPEWKTTQPFKAALEGDLFSFVF